MRQRKKNKIIILSLIGLLCIMTAGYAAFQTNLKIKGTSKVNSNWDIRITSVTQANKTGSAEEAKAPTWDNLTAYMEANLYEKGDSIEYNVIIENKGTIDAALENITDNIKSTNEAVKISFSGYTKGEKLLKDSSQTIKVKIEYNPDFNGTPEEGSGETNITLDYVQAEGGTINPADRYLITYDCSTNGGDDCSVYNEYKAIGESINLLNTATKEGYEFIGWNTDKDANESLTELNMLNNNITLYAIFKDVTPPECEITVTKITTNNIQLKANCDDASGVKEYKYIQNDNVETTTKDTYNLTNYKLKELSVEVVDNYNNKNIFTISEETLQETYNQILEVLENGYSEIAQQQKDAELKILDKAYPIGSIYITETNTNPSEIIGETWEEYGKGKILVGVDENDINFNTVNKVGGNKTSTLAVMNLPSHTHGIQSFTGLTSENGNHMHITPKLSATTSSNGAHTHTRGTMDIKGSIQSLDSAEPKVGLPTGAFYPYVTVDYYSYSPNVTLTSGSHRYDGFSFQASRNWTGETSSNGAHTHKVSFDSNVSANNGNHSHTIATEENITSIVGENDSFTNLSKYNTIKMWKRIR